MFWDYFRKTLRFPLIWKEGPLAQLAKGGADVLDIVTNDIKWLRDQFIPELADPAYINKIAVGRGLRRWQPETDASWIARVVYAYLFWKKGGTVPGMLDTLEIIGFSDATIEEIGLTDQTRWAEFYVHLDISDGDPYVSYIIEAINDIKPARSKATVVLRSFPQAPLRAGVIAVTHIQC